MNYDVEFAQWLKERNNKNRIGSIIGKVVKESPNYIINIGDNDCYIDTTNSTLCENLKTKKGNSTITIDGITYNIEVKFDNKLNINDAVLVIADESNQHFFIVDKI
ncbi:DUF2577 domain-containing protein [Clostridium sporogenes]|uniref:DUF2577 family protein n=1 Tax=Clostridium sporogenes TaxID=1509 RepID=UPI0013D32948|nr:DUF2577 family protein [Clostridium sporogenes]NFF69324.1 DUF2577 domain-containing protein [Clostridium sporogenes]NFG00663.1 DUF2577 domain-containing protein [Clostridium sporogenes]NFG08225.1 DUF2577 domain-containing protein [Clostridium sporogenes]NFG53352.1 DUF2577 domain-containing protein [Clostridium sporogenes]NFP86185.1 DUF2577 domain-containing protein [Clostridium sporogenes]